MLSPSPARSLRGEADVPEAGGDSYGFMGDVPESSSTRRAPQPSVRIDEGGLSSRRSTRRPPVEGKGKEVASEKSNSSFDGDSNSAPQRQYSSVGKVAEPGVSNWMEKVAGLKQRCMRLEDSNKYLRLRLKKKDEEGKTEATGDAVNTSVEVGIDQLIQDIMKYVDSQGKGIDWSQHPCCKPFMGEKGGPSGAAQEGKEEEEDPEEEDSAGGSAAAPGEGDAS